jgi:7-carboxy-7-deazaguanine synthase
MMDRIYIPTIAEQETVAARGDFLKVSGDGVFATRQGEGVTAGMPAVFLRLQDCNLHCGANNEGWRCDAWYTWDKDTPEYWQETTNLSIDDAETDIRNAWNEAFPDEVGGERIVITGGEPLLQQRKLVGMLDRFADWDIEIETNGTIAPLDELQRCQLNCSPKLASSGNPDTLRHKPNALSKIASFPNAWFKFVVSQPDDLAEIETIAAANDIAYERVLLMSEGVDPKALRASDERLTKIARGLGCGVTARNHIFWYGDKRRT